MRIQLSMVGDRIHLQAQLPSIPPGEIEELNLLLVPGERFGNIDYDSLRRAAETKGFIDADELDV